MSTGTDPRRRGDVRVESITRPPSVTSDGLWGVIKNCWDLIPEDRRPAYALVVELRKLEMEVRREIVNLTDHSLTAESPVHDGGAPAGILGASLSWTEDDGDRSVATLRRQFGSSPGEFIRILEILYTYKMMSGSARRRTPQTKDSGYFDTPTLKRSRGANDLTPGAGDETPTRKKIRGEDALPDSRSRTQAPSERGPPLASSTKLSPSKRVWVYAQKILGKTLRIQRSPEALVSSSTISAVNNRAREGGAQGNLSNAEESGGVGARSPSTSPTAKRKRQDEELAEASPSRGTKKSKILTPNLRRR